jgi:hypothetical protein
MDSLCNLLGKCALDKPTLDVGYRWKFDASSVGMMFRDVADEAPEGIVDIGPPYPGDWLIEVLESGPIRDVTWRSNHVTVEHLEWEDHTHNPVASDTGVLAVCPPHVFRCDDSCSLPHTFQFRSYILEKPGDRWMIQAIQEVERWGHGVPVCFPFGFIVDVGPGWIPWKVASDQHGRLLALSFRILPSVWHRD